MNQTNDICLKRLSNLFEKHKDINITDFFKAPYSVYSNEETFDLKFYTTQKAITVYKIFLESKNKS
jgi:hypothetical protein